MPYEYSWSKEYKRPQHSAVVASINANGVIDIFEQHVQPKLSVQRRQIYINNQVPREDTLQIKTYNLSNPRHRRKLYNMFGKNAISKISKNHRKIKLKEKKRNFRVEVLGNIWAYTPVQKD